MVDKNLFMYDLTIVAIMKNEEPYIKEWLDYHLLAGVNHFYIYDNESSDNMKEVLQPYIERGIVTYIFYPGKARQYEAYDDAILNYRFFCRYMAFIDGDEFIFPQNNKSIVEVLDEVLANDRQRAGLAINWHQFGSNFQEQADYSRGVLERFTRRASDENIWIDSSNNLPAGNALVKSILNPRKVDYFWNPHFAKVYLGLNVVNENGVATEFHYNNPPTVKKIVINHYPHKSREEYEKKVARGVADGMYNVYKDHPFSHIYNNEFDDAILKYRDYRKKILLPKSLRKKTFSAENFPIESEMARAQRIFDALQKNLLSVNPENLPKDFFKEKLENFLVCLIVSEKYQFKLGEKIFSEYALNWIYHAMNSKINLEECLLLLSSAPEILKTSYPMTEKIREGCLNIIPKIIEFYRTRTNYAKYAYYWEQIFELKSLLRILQSFDAYKK